LYDLLKFSFQQSAFSSQQNVSTETSVLLDFACGLRQAAGSASRRKAVEAENNSNIKRQHSDQKSQIKNPIS